MTGHIRFVFNGIEDLRPLVRNMSDDEVRKLLDCGLPRPLAILSTHSYAAEGGKIRGELVIAEHMTMTAPRLGDRVLLVDDMVDSGHTLAAVHDELPRRFPHIAELHTAVLWWKACSVFKPDFYVDYLADSPWIRQPFEVYDDLSPEQLAERLGVADVTSDGT